MAQTKENNVDLNNLKNTAKDALGDEKSTDAALDKVVDAINGTTSGKFADKVQQARDFADGRLGDERK